MECKLPKADSPRWGENSMKVINRNAREILQKSSKTNKSKMNDETCTMWVEMNRIDKKNLVNSKKKCVKHVNSIFQCLSTTILILLIIVYLKHEELDKQT